MKFSSFLAGCIFLTATYLPANEVVQFNRDVRPILADACFACHGPDAGQREGDHRFDTEAGLQAAREGKLIVAGNADASQLIARVLSNDPDEKMPPASTGKTLTVTQIDILRRWIEQGGKWQQHWAYLPPQKVEPPDPASGRHPIDQFVDKKIHDAKLVAAPVADDATLIRRLSFDLTGLPPTSDEVDAFKKSASINRNSAIETAVDRMLSSPQFGERLALYWLDLVRYADSVGYHKDSHRNVWLYRDYVIQSFNDNTPFDQFVIEQLAGDLLEGSKLDQFEWKIASGFNRMNQTTSEGGAQAKEYIAKYAADRVRNTSAIFLGSTMGCTECHDHKYDPFTTRDFYQFSAFFADLQERGVGFPTESSMPSREQVAKWRDLEAQKKAEKDATKLASLNTQLKTISDSKTWSRTIVTISGKPRSIRILPRGNWLDDSGEIVEPAIPQFLGSLDLDGRRATRLDLAKWIASRDNPLTARVFVNRMWKLFYGHGISQVLDDVGAQGEWPTHPDLLDWLAVDFMENGWDVKRLVKTLVMTETYRRSSTPSDELQKLDPENQYFARQARFRLDAEFVRDNALAISGLLSKKMFGRSVKPYQPANYWFRLYKDGSYKQDHGEDLYRRGIYTYWRRSYWHPSLQAFDAPAREECVAQRPTSNTPQQSLVLLNDPTFVEAARVLAERMIKDGGETVEGRVALAFRRALARPPEAWELDVFKKLHAKHAQRFADDEEAAKKLVSVGEHHLPKDIPVTELATWTSIARVILNLHETITRN